MSCRLRGSATANIVYALSLCVHELKAGGAPTVGLCRYRNASSAQPDRPASRLASLRQRRSSRHTTARLLYVQCCPQQSHLCAVLPPTISPLVLPSVSTELPHRAETIAWAVGRKNSLACVPGAYRGVRSAAVLASMGVHSELSNMVVVPRGTLLHFPQEAKMVFGQMFFGSIGSKDIYGV